MAPESLQNQKNCLINVSSIFIVFCMFFHDISYITGKRSVDRVRNERARPELEMSAVYCNTSSLKCNVLFVL